MRAVADEFGVPVHGHAYKGDILYAFKHFDILGPNLSLAHVTGISDEEIQILADTGTHVLSGPMTNAYINARCPVVELLDRGVNVAFCTDASAPNRSYDLLEKLRIGLWLHRSHFKDADVLTAGKALEMITIDAARALGLDTELGSLEEGKKADVVLINAQKPHLYPLWQEPLRLGIPGLGTRRGNRDRGRTDCDGKPHGSNGGRGGDTGGSPVGSREDA